MAARTFTTPMELLVRGASTPLVEMIPSFLLSKQRLSPKSAVEYERYLREFCTWANGPTLGELMPDLVNRYLRERKVRSLYAARFAGAVLKSFASWLADEAYLRAPLGGSVLTSVKVPRVPSDGRPAIEDADIQRIQHALQTSPHKTRARDSALFWLLLATGLRRNEARELRLSDVHIDRAGSFVDVRWRTSKGRESRRIRLDPKAAAAIHLYIADWRVSANADELFTTAEGKPFTRAGFGSYTARLTDQFEKAGVRGWMPHRMRTTWATWYHRASPVTGNSVYDLQREGGWKDDSTPRRYTKDRPWEELQAMPTPTSIILAKMRAG